MIEQLNIGEKTQNQGVNAAGKLTAEEFNALTAKVKAQEEFDALVEGGKIKSDVEYNVYED